MFSFGEHSWSSFILDLCMHALSLYVLVVVVGRDQQGVDNSKEGLGVDNVGDVDENFKESKSSY